MRAKPGAELERSHASPTACTHLGRRRAQEHEEVDHAALSDPLCSCPLTALAHIHKHFGSVQPAHSEKYES